ncbi:DUF3139 domain-containing protein [Alkalicoccus saliphilus]|uniref:Uncharacterized protein n=1 Tax=Alkalicoccus saliphilus TaxID=200989 RepID=A0A2T4U7B4_9BACI|nr:DUF3139 domain-containing protein [Alkalicoccus saliphilus]PTL39288.1 hypothetical protein C6Y45_06660 [Alkalicoccus saliphilus]
MKTKLISIFVFFTIAAVSVYFYQSYIAEYSNNVETAMALGTAGLAALLFFTAVFIPKRILVAKGIAFTLFLAVALVCIVFWLVRPYQIIYTEIPERMAILDEHLQEEYPEREWEIEKNTSAEDPVFLLLVTFEDEPEYEYRYLMDEETAEGESPVESSGRQPSE